MTANALDDEDAPLDFGWKICAGVLAAFAVIGMLPIAGENDKPLFFRLPAYTVYFWIVIGVAAACLIASAVLFRLRKKNRPFMQLSVWMTAFASVVCLMTTLYYTAADIPSARLYTDAAVNGEIYESVGEDNFFRIDISEDCDNYSMLWGLPNMRAFQSVVNTSIMDFYHEIGLTRDVASRANIEHYTLRGLFSVKYYYRELYKNKTYEDSD